MNELDFDIGGDKLREECGVFGIYDLDGGDVASTIYYGLFALQHRGQESCGIAVSDTEGPKGQVPPTREWACAMRCLRRSIWNRCTEISAWAMCAIPRRAAAPGRTPSRWCSTTSRAPWRWPTTAIW